MPKLSDKLNRFYPVIIVMMLVYFDKTFSIASKSVIVLLMMALVAWVLLND